MVNFVKLRLHGFKSFVETTELAIQPGMTGIVGPNGCGKSNLVEALRWVMGETSAKRMRGGEMDDVIFGGTGSRPARNVAEVQLLLDNTDRKVPAQFNHVTEIEISRRIDRGMGSTYRVNGSEARARDVQILFADVSTGAHSTALVSQGRIGAIINAKPVDRRALLEEAAGITGLHSRRHEAELRLKAAEANLSRLDDVIVTLESQLAALKKQARQANRYRNLQDHIRRAEATLSHLHWLDATARKASADTAHQEAEAAVIALTEAAAVAATHQAEAVAVLPGLRQSEAEASAELQHLTISHANLGREEERIAAELAGRQQQLQDNDRDTDRATQLAADAADAAQRLGGEAAELEDVTARESVAAEEADRAVTQANAALEECETELAQLTGAVAEGEAKLSALNRRMNEVSARIANLAQRRQDAEAELERLRAEIANDAEIQSARATLQEAEARLETAQAGLTAAEAARTLAAGRDASAHETHQSLAAQRAKLQAESDALASLFAGSDSEMWPPLIDALTVAPGYEQALGVALGDELQASTDTGAPVHWRDLGADQAALELPGGLPRLSDFVTGSSALLRRLNQIAVAPDEATGRSLAPALRQGQRIVTREGAMWRWDGFTVATEAATAAATRLKQRNRLNELTAELAAGLAAVESAASDATRAREEMAALTEREQSARQALQVAYGAARQAREATAAAEQRAVEKSTRMAALDQVVAGIAGDTAEAEQQLAASRAELEALPDLQAGRDRVAELRPILAERRARLIECRSASDRLAREAETRSRRRAAIEQELASWRDRATQAERHIQELAERRDAIAAEIARLEGEPARIAGERARLFDLIAAAEEKRRHAADALAEAEAALSVADRSLKAEEARLHEARENRVRAEALVAQATEAAETLAAHIREKLECAPEQVLELAELDPGEPLPDHGSTEQRLQRLLRERENIGPVNLRAETEASELEQQLAGMQTERSDLVNAISRLRQGIASLNREGRERLLAAFELVNGHFENLFTRLFGGGKAHLKLTESEDPLEAGLEILASPPGKKLQVMSLLSGGEQALTALALLFAVFLVNPAPICVLDEVDAPLDDANVERFCDLVEELARETGTRFLVITHHRLTMARMDRLFGVTMAERGVSQLVSVDLQEAARLRAAS
ncbi:MAG TPA: chromosome segregation protein SMC [Candidatus Cybelea sp.]|nr:chromosome segregation protein SMC [Candidatus Cybelea sp.]